MPCSKVTKIFTSFKIRNPIKPATSRFRFLPSPHTCTTAKQASGDSFPAERSFSAWFPAERVYTDSWMTVITPCHSVTFHPMRRHPIRPWHCAGARSDSSKPKLCQAASSMRTAQRHECLWHGMGKQPQHYALLDC